MFLGGRKEDEEEEKEDEEWQVAAWTHCLELHIYVQMHCVCQCKFPSVVMLFMEYGIL
jgi:hypothetical protein